MLTKPSHFVAVGSVLAACVVGYLFSRHGPSAPVTQAYNPSIDPNNFVPQVNNKYFTLVPGTKFTYEDRTGTLRIEVTVTYPGTAEDMGTVIASDRKVAVPYGTMANCVQVQDSTPLESRREFAFLALEKLVGWGAEAELVTLSRP